MLRGVPRTRGAHPVGDVPGAVIRLSVTGWLHRPAESLAAALADTVRSIGTGPVDLQANGNTYANLRLERCTPLQRGLSDMQFDCTFYQEISP
jgi:hypothetical protein